MLLVQWEYNKRALRNDLGVAFQNASVILVCFSLNEPGSVNNVRDWIARMSHYVSGSTLFQLVGTKSDLPIEVDMDEIHSLAELHGMSYAECSAKSGDGVEELFTNLTERVLAQVTANKGYEECDAPRCEHNHELTAY